VIDHEDATRLVFEGLDMWDTTQTEVPRPELQARYLAITPSGCRAPSCPYPYPYPYPYRYPYPLPLTLTPYPYPYP
jgi:hypothetical protein